MIVENSPPLNMEHDDWVNILYAIRRNECVIVLGPGAAINANGTKLQDELCSQIAGQLKMNEYDRHDSLFSLSDRLMKQNGGRGALADQVISTYHGNVPNAIHHQLAQLPVSLYISASPDMMLKAAMESVRFNFSFSYFHPKKTLPVEEEPTPSKPLIYNLFGCIQEEDSCILTHDHLFEFLFSILGLRPIPEVVLNTIKKAQNFIFLGFDFESWYLKLMLRKFGLHEKDLRSYAFSLPNQQPGTVQFYYDKFKLVFVNNTVTEIENFVHELFIRCQSKMGNQMRQESAMPAPFSKDELQKLLEENQLNQVFTILQDKCPHNPDASRTLALVRKQYNEMTTAKQRGTWTNEQLRVESALIAEQLTIFIDAL